ncbi:MAG: hypothetical protein IME93_07520 [Proteobacteria bacterium]|nr:hypothetical protein [Pseudomonadota bacterium]
MLAFIISMMQSYEKSHGVRPQLVYLNQKHLIQLLEECPWLQGMEDRPALGFRIVLISEKELPHPRVIWIPPLRRQYQIKRNMAEVETPCYDGPYCAAVRH